MRDEPIAPAQHALPPHALLDRQWRAYGRNHANSRNLLLHIVAIPLFMAGTILLAYGLFRLNLPAIALGLVCAGMSLALQGKGHRLEAQAPEPFAGPADMARRILAEQWITFPRFVVTGRWWAALRGRIVPAGD
jgi:hypothetical protein